MNGLKPTIRNKGLGIKDSFFKEKALCDDVCKVWFVTQGSYPQTNRRRQRNSMLFIRWKLSSECRLSPNAKLI